ncbi:hypothetical protein KAF44_19650 (plasmid) [Cupriavidus necator]|nr:hypothetical protein KAF44_19650 [Cupriavidus necator]
MGSQLVQLPARALEFRPAHLQPRLGRGVRLPLGGERRLALLDHLALQLRDLKAISWPQAYLTL